MENKSQWDHFDGTCDTCPIAHTDNNIGCDLFHKLNPGKCLSQSKDKQDNSK